jgi:hypothetical protein
MLKRIQECINMNKKESTTPSGGILSKDSQSRTSQL